MDSGAGAMVLAEQLQVGQQCAGAPTSPVRGFWLPELPGEQLLAYGSIGATVVVAHEVSIPASAGRKPTILQSWTSCSVKLLRNTHWVSAFAPQQTHPVCFSQPAAHQ